jgi:hypothetical protein
MVGQPRELDNGMTDQEYPVRLDPWITRARAVEKEHGAITPQQIVSAEDLATLDRTRDLMAALYIIFADTMPSGLAANLSVLLAELRWQATELTNPERNWNEGHPDG